MAVCGKKLKQLFDEEDRGLFEDPNAVGKASTTEKTLGRSKLIGDKKISGSSRFSSSSGSSLGSKQSGRSIRKGDKVISGSSRFANDISAGSPKHCKEGCKHCEEDTYHGDEVSQSHVIRRRENIKRMDWDNFESSRSLSKSETSYSDVKFNISCDIQ